MKITTPIIALAVCAILVWALGWRSAMLLCSAFPIGYRICAALFRLCTGDEKPATGGGGP